MLPNKKIQSFTLSEMMIVLVISAIVISLAITILNLVQQQIKSITNNFERTAEIKLLERTLTYDFNKYNLYYNRKDKLLLCFSPYDTITYNFNQPYIVRNKDTFQLHITNTSLFLDGQNVKEKTIDALKLALSNEFQNKQIFVFKQKDATYYLNN